MDKGEYNRAVGEFERFIHFFPDAPQIPTAHYLIGMCYLKDSSYEEAREIFFHIIRSDPDSTRAGKALFLIGESYYQQGVSGEAEHYFGQVAEKYPHLDLKSVAFYRLGWTKMQAGRWRNASKFFNKVEKESPYYDSSMELVEQSLRGETLPYKMPVFAGSLAALIPGLGHAYVSRYRDAVVAFLLNGIFVWAAAESFHQDHEVLGGVLTFLELGWYTGNIYSAVNVAHKHNRKVQNDFRKSLKDRLDIHLLTAKEGHIGMALTFRF
jgi:tetratricopeptide (TPR) repeat protein